MKSQVLKTVAVLMLMMVAAIGCGVTPTTDDTWKLVPGSIPYPTLQPCHVSPCIVS